MRRITYVEDDADIRGLAQLTLEDIGGYELQLCASGAQAIATAAEFAPDIILLDRMMPGMDGLEAFAGLRALPGLAETPIVFMTGRTETEDRARYRALGAIGVIEKPFDPMTLAADLETLWRQAQLSEVPG